VYDSRSMPLAANTRLGPYEIVSPQGAASSLDAIPKVLEFLQQAFPNGNLN
jgi:hypothetical protein